MDDLKTTGINSLRWLEKYTKTDMVYLAKGGFWLGLGQFFASGSAFVTSVIFANMLIPETYGIYKFILSINSIILVTTLTGMDSSVTQAISRGFEGTLIPAIKEKMRWGLLGSIVSIFISIYYYTNGNLTLSISFFIVSIFIPFTESTDMYNSLLWGKKLFNIQAKYNIINVLIILLSVATTLFFTKNIYIILSSYLLALTIPNLLFLYKTIKYHKTNDNIDENAIGYGKHLSLISIIGLVVSQLDKILVFHYIGAANLAIYSLAVAPTDQIKGLLKNLNSLAMPKFSENTVEQIKKTIWHKVFILFIITTFIVVFYIILLPFFFDIFFPKYIESIKYSSVLSLSLIPVIIAGFLYTILESQKAKTELYKHSIYTNIFSIITLLPLIYFWGIWGAIIARIVNRTFILGLSTILIKKLN